MADIHVKKIERGIAVPDRRQYHKGRWKTLLEAMKVNDSFTIAGDELNTVRQCVSRYRRYSKTKAQWTIRKVGTNQWRCWRVK